jgi:hypothetical protein
MYPAPTNQQASEAGKESIAQKSGGDNFFLAVGNLRTIGLPRNETQPKNSSIEIFWSNLQHRYALYWEVVVYAHLVSPANAFAGNNRKESHAVKELSGQQIFRNITHEQGTNIQSNVEKGNRIHARESLVNPSILLPWVLENILNQGAWSGDLDPKLDPSCEDAKIIPRICRSITAFSNQIIHGNDGAYDANVNSAPIVDIPGALIFATAYPLTWPTINRIFEWCYSTAVAMCIMKWREISSPSWQSVRRPSAILLA